MKEKYNKEKIKKIFQIYRDIYELELNDDEYDIFCTAISFLDEKIIDKIYKEIHFIGFNESVPAFYTNLTSKDLEKKKAIIYISHLIFEHVTDKNKKYFFILHEIAHHILKYRNFVSLEEKNKVDKKADELASEWLKKVGIIWPPNKRKD